MADGKGFSISPQLDIMQILQEANARWLRPNEICEILRNYQKFKINADPPYRPPGGSLFLFDRKALRYFRKDGHNWRKKKDGKTVREAHEKLKSGSIDVLHCYYAHGEDNESFQRRSYWMLDGKLEHIVLVHYRDVNEGGRSNLSTLPLEFGPTDGVATSFPYSTFSSPLVFPSGVSNASASNVTDGNLHSLSSGLDGDSAEGAGGASNTESMSYSGVQISSSRNNIGQESISDHTMSFTHGYSGAYFDNEITSKLHDPVHASELHSQNLVLYQSQHENCGASQISDLVTGAFVDHRRTSFQCADSFSKNRRGDGILEHKTSSGQANWSGDMTMTLMATISEAQGALNTCTGGQYYSPHNSPKVFVEDIGNQVEVNKKIGENFSVVNHHNLMNESNNLYQLSNDQLSKSTAEHGANNSKVVNQVEYEAKASDDVKNCLKSEKYDNEHGTLKKLDSFGRWMNSEIGKDCDDSLMASNSSNFWKAIDSQSEGKDMSSFSSNMQLDTDSLGPSLSQVQLFSISDFSPDWAYSGVETKVLITGEFLGIMEPRKIKWSCMFGEVEVYAELVANNVLRCRAPSHSPGRIPFYITCSNRLACSEIREFEYRENLSRSTYTGERNSEEYSHLQVQLAKLLSMAVERKWLFCSVEKCQKCILKQKLFTMLKDDRKDWEIIEKDCKAFHGDLRKPRDSLIEKLLKDKLYEWLVCRIHEEGKGPNVLDEEGQGVIHLAAALGYVWAIYPLISTGVSPSFRDVCGRTGLHWAAYFGREGMVVELVKLGAAPGAVEDPTSKFPQGQTAADLASSRGHKGISGYLAEADLTSHLRTLTINENVMDSVSATLAAEEAIQTVQEQNVVSSRATEQLSLRGSLAAVRNSAQAAARIQAAFRLHSFRLRQLMENKGEAAETFTDMMVLSSSNKSYRIGHYNESLHKAATRIQQKYRGWKGRKEFLKIRDRIVKIQAHFRGHQVRKQYKKVVWSVGIVEKAILRWRRKGTGLRGFRAVNTTAVEQKAGEVDEYDFLRIGRRQKAAGVEKALQRVQSMARNPEGRAQYMRLLAQSQRLKLGDDESSHDHTQSTREGNKGEEDTDAV